MPEAYDRKIARVKEVAGDRFDSMEINSLAMNTSITDDAMAHSSSSLRSSRPRKRSWPNRRPSSPVRSARLSRHSRNGGPLGLQLCGCSAEWRPGHGTVQRGHRRPRRHLRPTREFGPADPQRLGARDPNHHQIGRLLILCLREWADPPPSTDLLDQQPQTIGPSAMPLARTVSSGRSSRRACNAVLVTGRERHDLGAVGSSSDGGGVAVASRSRRVPRSSRSNQGSVEIIDDGHVGYWSATAARTASRSRGDELALGDDHEIRRLSCRSRSGRVRSSASRSRKFVASTRTTTPSTEPIALGPRHDLCGVSDAAELNHHMIRWVGRPRMSASVVPRLSEMEQHTHPSVSSIVSAERRCRRAASC